MNVWQNIDTIKAIVTYLTAMIAALGGMAAIIYIGGNPAQADTKTIIAGFVGGSFVFLFNQEVQTRTARQAAAATYAAKLNSNETHDTFPAEAAKG